MVFFHLHFEYHSYNPLSFSLSKKHYIPVSLYYIYEKSKVYDCKAIIFITIFS